MKLSEFTADQGMTIALEILLDEGFQPQYGYNTWNDLVDEEFDEKDYEYSLYDYYSVWSVIEGEYIPTGKKFSKDGKIFATLVEGATRGLLDPDEYYVVVSLSDGETTRYFKRDGYYSSYGESSLSDAYNVEVTAKQVTITDWQSVK